MTEVPLPNNRNLPEEEKEALRKKIDGRENPSFVASSEGLTTREARAIGRLIDTVEQIEASRSQVKKTAQAARTGIQRIIKKLDGVVPPKTPVVNEPQGSKDFVGQEITQEMQAAVDEQSSQEQPTETEQKVNETIHDIVDAAETEPENRTPEQNQVLEATESEKALLKYLRDERYDPQVLMAVEERFARVRAAKLSAQKDKQ